MDPFCSPFSNFYDKACDFENNFQGFGCYIKIVISANDLYRNMKLETDFLCWWASELGEQKEKLMKMRNNLVDTWPVQYVYLGMTMLICPPN